MKMIDLHTHSTASDGTFTPRELVAYAAEKNIDTIALTDHDTLAGLPEAELAGKEFGVRVINGAEFTTLYENVSLHIVGLFLPQNDSGINSRLEEMREKRNKRNEKMVEKLREMGVEISIEELRQKFGKGVISRAHIAQLMLEKGYISHKDEAFARYIGSHCRAYVQRESLSPQETIQLIKNAGGVAVWAHPLLCKVSDRNIEKIAGVLRGCGLDAIEAYYPTHSPSDTKFVKTVALKNGLALSGGSDFHGSIKPKLELGTGYGNLAVPYEILEQLEKLRG